MSLQLSRYNKRTKRQEQLTLTTGLQLPAPPLSATESLPPALQQPAELPQYDGDDHAYALPANTAAVRKRPQGPHRLVAEPPTPCTVTGQIAVGLQHNQQLPEYSVEVLVDTSPQATVATTFACGLLSTETSTPQLPLAAMSRATAYRHKHKSQLGVQPVYKRHKQFNSCSTCGQPMIAATGHCKHRSYVYCPSSGKSTEDWMAEVDRRICAKTGQSRN